MARGVGDARRIRGSLRAVRRDGNVVWLAPELPQEVASPAAGRRTRMRALDALIRWLHRDRAHVD
jgi:hypothetical protein